MKLSKSSAAMLGKLVFLAFLVEILASGSSVNTDPEATVKTDGSRIVSGWPARDGQFPYMLFVRGVNQFGHVMGCGGSIIHARWGLTSGRCTVQQVTLILSAGMVNINRPRLTFETSTYFQAPGFENLPISQPNDLALIGFNRDIQFNTYIQPIRLQRSADRQRDYSGVLMSTAGWGTTFTPDWNDENVLMSEDLNWVHLVGVNNFVCLLMVNSNWLVRESTVCAQHYNVTSQSICSGDSGVPLTIVDTDNRPTQIGVASFVVSWGCHVGFPAGFVRPAFYQDWMRQITGINFDW